MIQLLTSAAVVLLFAALALRLAASLGLPLPARAPAFLRETPPALQPVPRRDLLRVFGFALLLRVGLLLAGGVAAVLAGQAHSPAEALSALNRWDAVHYVHLVQQGYAGYMEDGQPLFLVFFPAYVWLTRAMRLLVPHTLAAGTLVSCLCFAGGCCYVYRIGASLYGRAVGRDAVLYLSLFPFSFFFGSVMTESLFLLALAAAFDALLRRRWLVWGLWGALAALTRMTGVLVLLPAGIVLLRGLLSAQKDERRRALRRLPLLPLPLLGTGVYLLLNFAVAGDAFAFVRMQQHWYQGYQWIGGVMAYLWDYAAHSLFSADGWAIWWPQCLLFLAFFALLAVSLRDCRHPSGLLCWAFAYFVANYSLSWLLSAGRYLSCGFVFFLLLAALTEKRPALRCALLCAQAVGLGIYFFAYVSGASVM